MKRRLIPIFLYIIILLMTSMACKLVSSVKDQVTESDPPIQKQNEESNLLGEEYVSSSGGFSFNQIKGYEFSDVIGIIQMAAPAADPNMGPMFMMVGGLNEFDSTPEESFQRAVEATKQFTYSENKKVQVNGANGLEADISGEIDGQPVAGRMTIVMVTPRQMFAVSAIAPADDWKELAATYKAVLASIRFFEAVPEVGFDEALPTDEPTAEALGSQGSSDDGQTPILVRQWAAAAFAGSEYAPSDWSAAQATGEPNVDSCGDNTKAWASAKSDSIDWIELTYEIPVYPTEINIYQSYNPSQISEIEITDINGESFTIWAESPQTTENCPDLMTITVDLEGKEILVEKITLWIDQSVLGLGWAEIDAVELVGYTSAGQVAQQPQESSTSTPQENQPVTGNYTGWMAGPVYQGYLKVIPGETLENDLNQLIGLEGKKSTENWKPRQTHANTFIFDFKQDGMKAFISVDTSGVVYKKEISSGTYPSDFILDTVTEKTYKELDAIYKRDQVIPYPVMANLLQSPGFLYEHWLREDGVMVASYTWYNRQGDKIIGSFYNGKLTGIAGLALIPKQ